MLEEWLEIAWINFDKAILHGHIAERDADGVRREREVEQVLTDQQKATVVELNERHRRETLAILRGLVAATPTQEAPMH